jgi:hypothetical protein
MAFAEENDIWQGKTLEEILAERREESLRAEADRLPTPDEVRIEDGEDFPGFDCAIEKEAGWYGSEELYYDGGDYDDDYDDCHGNEETPLAAFWKWLVASFDYEALPLEEITAEICDELEVLFDVWVAELPVARPIVGDKFLFSTIEELLSMEPSAEPSPCPCGLGTRCDHLVAPERDAFLSGRLDPPT